ncbi:hypothetical protein B0H14DRAFT_3523365 [Mycena olivaceomarginata]|nr:hypothetical protein B0H14DRAFT_3523365 [Mycena olivaceomarginata]
MSAALGYHKVSSSIYTLTASLFQQYTDSTSHHAGQLVRQDVRRQHAQIPISDICNMSEEVTIDDVAFHDLRHNDTSLNFL